MDELRPLGATIPTEGDLLYYMHPADKKRGYAWWIKRSSIGDPIYVEETGCLRTAKIIDIHEIVPKLLCENFRDGGFDIGDTFKLKGLKFKIINSTDAICLDSIGAESFDSYDYETSSVQEALDDWFETFIRGAVINRPFSILDIYDIIPFEGHIGRYCIINKNGKIRHSASGHGFMSEEKARNMLLGYASHVPIPDEDIEAYENFLSK